MLQCFVNNYLPFFFFEQDIRFVNKNNKYVTAAIEMYLVDFQQHKIAL
jgi:hypothetical protein